MGNWHRKAKSVDHWEPLVIFRFPFCLENILVITLFSVMFILACLWAKLPMGMGLRSVSIWLLSENACTRRCSILTKISPITRTH
jgi:hypothetical protein